MNPKRRISLEGKRFGMLAVLSFSHLHPTKRIAIWNCRCDCGTEKPVRSDFLRIGKAKSCGCASPKFKPGECRSPKTQFSPGQDAHNHLAVGSETIRTDKRGVRRAWLKVAEPNVWKFRAVAIWESINGPVPKGMLIHHVDRNTLNDAPDNLQAMTKADHVEEHRKDFAEAQRAAVLRTVATLKERRRLAKRRA